MRARVLGVSRGTCRDEAWDMLPGPIRDGILAMVGSVGMICTKVFAPQTVQITQADSGDGEVGSEFTATMVREWLSRLDVRTRHIEPVSPWEDGYIESFNGKLRDELLNGEIFDTVLEARVLTERRRQEYNHVRPHSALGYRPPAAIQPWPSGSATTRPRSWSAAWTGSCTGLSEGAMQCSCRQPIYWSCWFILPVWSCSGAGLFGEAGRHRHSWSPTGLCRPGPWGCPFSARTSAATRSSESPARRTERTGTSSCSAYPCPSPHGLPRGCSSRSTVPPVRFRPTTIWKSVSALGRACMPWRVTS